MESIIIPLENNDLKYSGLKCFWGFIKSQCKDHTCVSSLKNNGITITDIQEKANILNKQFELAFTTKTPIPKDILPTSRCQTMPDMNITEPAVNKLLSSRSLTKHSGPYDISPCILKEMTDNISPILTNIDRKSLECGEIPNDWKKADVVPFFFQKREKKCDPANYQLISLTCIC